MSLAGNSHHNTYIIFRRRLRKSPPKYWVVRKVRAAKDLNLINEIKNLNLLRFNSPSKSVQTFRTTQYVVYIQIQSNCKNNTTFSIKIRYFP